MYCQGIWRTLWHVARNYFNILYFSELFLLTFHNPTFNSFIGESKCGNPGVPLHGNISVYQEAYAIGDSVLFSCDGGYVLSDHSSERISCQNDATWNQPIPSCESKVSFLYCFIRVLLIYK